MEDKKTNSLQETVIRVQKMEQKFHRAESVLEQFENGVESLNQSMPDFKELFAWYFDGCWMKDHELDEDNLLPADLNRGVLSEDAIYNLFWRLRELEESLLELERKLNALSGREKEDDC